MITFLTTRGNSFTITREKMMGKINQGFTLIELMVVIVAIVMIVIVGWVFAIKIVCQGNFWFDDASVFREIQIDHPDTARLLKTQRNIFDDSTFLVENKDGTRREHCLDTSIMWDYTFSDCAKPH